jgi:hypothetical protein
MGASSVQPRSAECLIDVSTQVGREPSTLARAFERLDIDA